jgi:MIP family channel proteins
VAEFVGTFAVVFVGAGSMLYGNLLGTAFAYGLVIAVMVTAFAGISGGHFNPAVTLAFLVTRRIAPAAAAVYWLVQLAGATIAALLLKWIFPAVVNGLFLGAPVLNPTIDSAKAVTIEGILTFFLVWVFFGTALAPRDSLNQVAGLAIGFTIVLDVAMGGGLTGAAMNPARAFGPQLASGHWTHFWVWYVGPLAGAALAAVLFELLYVTPSARWSASTGETAGAGPATDASA